MNFINTKTKTSFFDMTNVFISIFCFYITQFAEYVFNGFLIGTLLFYIYNVLFFFWKKMVSYRSITETEQPIQFVRNVSETFLIVKIFTYINNLNYNILLRKQIYLYSIIMYQLQILSNSILSIDMKQIYACFQQIVNTIYFKDIFISNIHSMIKLDILQNISSFNEYLISTINFDKSTKNIQITNVIFMI
jgi:hypothetical protein